MSAPSKDAQHRKFLDMAIELSRSGMEAKDGGPFGAIIVQGDKVIATGNNQVTSGCDPTAHAEMVAIRRACEALGRFDLRGCTIYSSCEPCPMCLGAIYWARLDALYFANSRQEAADIGFDDAHIYDELPLPIKERSLETFHLPSEEAREVFEAWTKLEGRVEY